MSRPAAARLAIAAAGGLLALLCFERLPGPAGIAGALAAFGLACGLAEASFRALASREEVRADLDDRVRNPPG